MPIGIVLGAGVNKRGIKRGIPWRGIIRINRAIHLWNSDKISHLILCGGFTNKHVNISEAAAMKRILTKKGIPANRIKLEQKSRNTYENAVNASKLTRSKNLIIITDGWHKKRSLILFKKVFSKRARITCA